MPTRCGDRIELVEVEVVEARRVRAQDEALLVFGDAAERRRGPSRTCAATCLRRAGSRSRTSCSRRRCRSACRSPRATPTTRRRSTGAASTHSASSGALRGCARSPSTRRGSRGSSPTAGTQSDVPSVNTRRRPGWRSRVPFQRRNQRIRFGHIGTSVTYSMIRGERVDTVAVVGTGAAVHVHRHVVRLARGPHRRVALVVERRCLGVVEEDRDGHALEPRGPRRSRSPRSRGRRRGSEAARCRRAARGPARRSRPATGCTRASPAVRRSRGYDSPPRPVTNGPPFGNTTSATTPSSSSSWTRRSESHWPAVPPATVFGLVVAVVLVERLA